jgi:hypothetical protein
MPQTHRGPFAQGQKFYFFYKQAQPRDYSRRLHAELAEARHYLEMGKARQRSSLIDYVLSATIFVACSIVLAWLLIASATHDTGKVATVATPVVPIAVAPPTIAEPAQRTAADLAAAPTGTRPVSNAASQREPKPSQYVAFPTRPALFAPHIERYPAARASTHDTAARRATKTNNEIDSEIAAARLNEAPLGKRLALHRSVHPTTRHTVSMQSEWTTAAQASTDNAATHRAWLDWRAAQQQRAQATSQASLSAPADTDWNAHTTQRRITDNPSAFLTPSGQN